MPNVLKNKFWSYLNLQKQEERKKIIMIRRKNFLLRNLEKRKKKIMRSVNNVFATVKPKELWI